MILRMILKLGMAIELQPWTLEKYVRDVAWTLCLLWAIALLFNY